VLTIPLVNPAWGGLCQSRFSGTTGDQLRRYLIVKIVFKVKKKYYFEFLIFSTPFIFQGKLIHPGLYGSGTFGVRSCIITFYL